MSSRKELNRQKTIQDIEHAFLSFYQKGGIDSVSISAICQRCNIARSTFYLYFEDKYAVLQGVEDRLLGKLWEICGNLPDILDHSEVSEAALDTIAHIRENQDWYRALLGSHGNPMFIYRWKRDIDKSLRKKLLQRNVSERDATLRGVLFASALIGLYTYVVQEYLDIPDETLCHYMDNMLSKLLD